MGEELALTLGSTKSRLGHSFTVGNATECRRLGFRVLLKGISVWGLDVGARCRRDLCVRSKSSRDTLPFYKSELRLSDGTLLEDVLISGNGGGNGAIGIEVADRLRSQFSASQVLLTPSCSAALEMSARLLHLQEGDEVIVPSFGFSTTASSFFWNGAVPTFADVSDRTLSLTPKTIDRALTSRTRAVCVLHYGGIPDNILELEQYCKQHGLALIEDNAHGLGSSFQGRPLGSFGALSTLSFHQTKHITCGEGGALVVNDSDLVEMASMLQEKGTDRHRFLRGEVDRYTWRAIGSSWVLSEILAAVLARQLDRVDEIIGRRRVIWGRYFEGLNSWAVTNGASLPHLMPGIIHAGHLFFVRFRSAHDASEYMRHMADRGVEVATHYKALNASPMGRRLGAEPGQCPVSEAASDDLVRLPLYSALSDSQVDRILEASVAFRPAL